MKNVCGFFCFFCFLILFGCGNSDSSDALAGQSQSEQFKESRRKMYVNGEDLPTDNAKAMNLYRLAVEQDDAEAQWKLGNIYYVGRGVPQDYAEAANWFRLAAEQGHDDAQYAFGSMLSRGKGVPKNPNEATNWFRLAAEQGNVNAQALVEIDSQSDALAEGAYTAVISCGAQGQNINVMACFDGTDLKITRGERSTVYKIYELQSLGRIYRDGLHISLPSSFSIKAQNGSEHLVLGLKILDNNGKTVFEDQAGRWGVIAVRN